MCRLVSARGSVMDRMALVESALDGLPDGILLVNTECEVAFWNQAAEAITGYSLSDLYAGGFLRAATTAEFARCQDTPQALPRPVIAALGAGAAQNGPWPCGDRAHARVT